MARYSGKIGYGESVETSPGVFTDRITEFTYFGDVVRNTSRFMAGAEMNDKISVQNSISIVADAYARENFFAIRYVEWAGVYWTVTEVELQYPRLLLRLGEVYNGLSATTPDAP